MTKEASVNFNSILITLCLGVMSWVGYTAQQTAVNVAVIAEKIANVTEKSSNQEREILDLRTRMLAVELAVDRLKKDRNGDR